MQPRPIGDTTSPWLPSLREVMIDAPCGSKAARGAAFLLEVLPHQRPVVRFPARSQMIVEPLGKADMFEDDVRAASMRLQLEARDRVRPFRPVHDAPRLNDALIG